MKKIELILILIALTGIIMVRAGIETAWYIIIPALLSDGLLYFFFGFAVINNIKSGNLFRAKTYRDFSFLHLSGSVLAGMSLSLVPLAVLFRLKEYPLGGTITFYAGIFSVLNLLIITLLYFIKKQLLYRENIIRFGIAVFIILAFMRLEIRI